MHGVTTCTICRQPVDTENEYDYVVINKAEMKDTSQAVYTDPQCVQAELPETD